MRESTKPIQIRLSPEEHDEINRQAIAKGRDLGLPKLSLSNYVRWLIGHHRKEEK